MNVSVSVPALPDHSTVLDPGKTVRVPASRLFWIRHTSVPPFPEIRADLPGVWIAVEAVAEKTQRGEHPALQKEKWTFSSSEPYMSEQNVISPLLVLGSTTQKPKMFGPVLSMTMSTETH